MNEPRESPAWPKGAPSIGDRAERTRSVTHRDVELFTEISGDRNPLHYDEEVAKATALEGSAVCYTMALPSAERGRDARDASAIGAASQSA
jgi:acyl dehydratase